VRLLFVHQNFPGQYRHLAAHYGAQAGCEVVGLGERRNVVRNRPHAAGVRVFGYEVRNTPSEDPFTACALNAIARGRAVAAAAAALRRSGLRPDVILAHIGWGEAIFLKDVFPEARVLLYCEFFYRSRGADLGFDPEFPATPEKRLRARIMNAPLLMSMDASDWGLAPTRWQQRQFAADWSRRISVIHDGVDTDRAWPGGERDGERMTEELVTYVARNLEPYRGFHVFMRAIPEIQRRRPHARIVIVGGDDVSYSPRLPGTETYRGRLLKELEGRIDLSRVEFRGRIPYADYLGLLRRSAVHVYLTYPFVLSWSLLEAMASGCLVVASRTPPVEEVIRHGENGWLVDFFSPEAIAARVDEALADRHDDLRARARETVVRDYDLRSVCLPQQLSLISRLAGSLPARPALTEVLQPA